jgi:hypothetical protein
MNESPLGAAEIFEGGHHDVLCKRLQVQQQLVVAQLSLERSIVSLSRHMPAQI